MVESVEFAPVTLEHLGCIPMLRVGTRNSLFYLKLFLMMTVFGQISLFEFESDEEGTHHHPEYIHKNNYLSADTLCLIIEVDSEWVEDVDDRPLS